MGDLEESLKKGALKFRLAGEKLHGGWMLTRLKRRPGDKKDNWLLIKEHDDAADPDTDILEARPESVKSGRNVEELKQGVDPTWQSKPATRPRKPRNVEPEKPAKPAALKPRRAEGREGKRVSEELQAAACDAGRRAAEAARTGCTRSSSTAIAPSSSSRTARRGS